MQEACYVSSEREKNQILLKESVRCRVINFQEGSAIKHNLDSDPQKSTKLIDIIIGLIIIKLLAFIMIIINENDYNQND